MLRCEGGSSTSIYDDCSAATGIGPNRRVAGCSSSPANRCVVGRPFVYEELVARMRAVLRRAGRPNHRCLVVRDIDIVLASRVVRVAGEAVQLSAKEFDLLVALAEDPERVFRKEELLRDVWGFRSLGRTRTLDSHASRLRRKLNRDGEVAYVLNVWGVGYRLVAGV